MCHFFAVLNTQPENTETINRLLKLNGSTLASQRSGYSVLRVISEPKVSRFPDIGDYTNFDQNVAYQGEATYICHTRTATGGESGNEGLHLQRVNGHYFAHNGFVGGFHKETKKNDSWHFFNKVTQHPVDLKSLLKAKDEDSFWGRATLFKPETDEFWAFGSELNLTALPGCLIFSTFPLRTVDYPTTHQEVLGYKFKDESLDPVEIPVLHQAVLEEAYYHFNHHQLVQGLENVWEPKTTRTALPMGITFDDWALGDDGIYHRYTIED